METIFRFFYWVRIALSPIILFGIFAFIIYHTIMTPLNLYLSIALAIIGIVLGVVLAEYARRKHGTMEFSARVMASPDFDDVAKKEKTK
jgi:hypothetical protein